MMNSKALLYLKEHKDEIVYNYDKENIKYHALKWNGEELYSQMIQILKDLYPLRNNESATDDYLENKLGQEKRHRKYWQDKRDDKLNDIETPPLVYQLDDELPGEYVASVKFNLLKAFKTDKSYGYAYFNLGSEYCRTHSYSKLYDDCTYHTDQIQFHINYDNYKIEDQIKDLNYSEQLVYLIKKRKVCLNDAAFKKELKQDFLNWCDNEIETLKELIALIPLEKREEQSHQLKRVEECIEQLNKVLSNKENEIRDFVINGRSFEKLLQIKYSSYKEFSDILYPYWKQKIIPRKYYSSWYDLIMNNFQKEGKDISRTTISSPINRNKI